MEIKTYWLKQISTLKVDRARGDPAPHKPLLLLLVFDLAEEGLLEQEILALTGELAFRFCTYWTAVAARRKQRPDIRMPFHHLSSGGFWAALTKEGKPSPDRKLTAFVKLDSSFLECIHDRDFRSQARRLLVGKYLLESRANGALCPPGYSGSSRNANPSRVRNRRSGGSDRAGAGSEVSSHCDSGLQLHLRSNWVPALDGHKRQYCGRRSHSPFR